MLTNLALQCPHCSLHKADKVAVTDTMSEEVASLFHPLRQVWLEHFMLDARGICSGTTPVGRVTVKALRMNDSLPRIARSVQIRLGLLACAGLKGDSPA